MLSGISAFSPLNEPFCFPASCILDYITALQLPAWLDGHDRRSLGKLSAVDEEAVLKSALKL